VQPLWELFSAARSGRIPTDEQIQAARQRVDWKRVQFTDHYVRLKGPNTRITLNGIAQGFATDRATKALQAHGILHGLIDAGEIGAIGADRGSDPWRIGIQHPRDEDAYISIAQLTGRCLATSGDYATTFSSDFRDHHIFDPRSGRSPRELASVSVVANSGIDADALSTAAFVLGARQGADLIRGVPGCSAFFVRKDGSTLMTPGFPIINDV
jgi:thiamine biosynthesis lipoprotein